MKIRIAPTLFLSLLLTVCSSALAQTGFTFTDGFEGQTINRFWTIVDHAGSGMVNLDTDVAHRGRRSVKVTTASTGGVEALIHSFPSPLNGVVSVWVYYSNVKSTGYKQLDIFNGPAFTGSDYLMYIDWGDLQTYLRDDNGSTFLLVSDRSTGWHQWTFSSSASDGVVVGIDGVEVFSSPVVFEFETVNLQQCCLAGSAFFDDFSVTRHH